MRGMDGLVVPVVLEIGEGCAKLGWEKPTNGMKSNRGSVAKDPAA